MKRIQMKRKTILVITLIIGVLLIVTLLIFYTPPDTLPSLPGWLRICFTPENILGQTSEETKEKIVLFIKSTGLEINISEISDPNIRTSISIWGEGVTPDLVEDIRNNPLVKKFEKGAYLKQPSGSGPTYDIVFKEGLYNKTLYGFINKYPGINLTIDYFSLPLEPICVSVEVPIEKENKYFRELKSKYPNEILRVERIVLRIL